MQVIQSKTIPEAYKKLIQTILDNGEWVNDERGQETLEILDIVTYVQDPIPEDYFHFNLPIYETITAPKGSFWSGERLEKYCEEFLSSDRKGFVYTYGNRYRGWFNNIDQIQVAIKRLQECRQSRRAISITWDPLTDTVNDEVPCMIFVDFKVRDNMLYTSATWRSHDIFGAWFPNIVGLTTLAQYVAKNLDNINVGPLTIFSISGHVYGNDLPAAKELMENNPLH